MYNGKHYKNDKKLKKSTALLLSLILVLGVAVGGTLAYLVNNTNTIKNVFTPSEVTTTVTENFDGEVKQNVQIKNTGDTTAWIRAAVVINWKDEDGNVYGQAPVEGTDYSITYTVKDTENDMQNGCWVKGKDGFYYWTKPVKSVKEVKEDSNNCLTGILIKECEPLSTNIAPEGYSLNVEIIGSGIQSVPASVFNTEWASSGLKVNEDGTALVSASNQGGAGK